MKYYFLLLCFIILVNCEDTDEFINQQCQKLPDVTNRSSLFRFIEAFEISGLFDMNYKKKIGPIIPKKKDTLTRDEILVYISYLIKEHSYIGGGRSPLDAIPELVVRLKMLTK